MAAMKRMVMAGIDIIQASPGWQGDAAEAERLAIEMLEPQTLPATHSPEPWSIDSRYRNHVLGGDGRHIAEFLKSTRYEGRMDADAARAVACVNACKGINPEEVPGLLAACHETLKLWGLVPAGAQVDATYDGAGTLRVALAKATEGV